EAYCRSSSPWPRSPLPDSQRGSREAASERRRARGKPVRRRSPALWTAALAGYAFLYIPLVIVVVYSFNDSRLNAEWVGFTFDWYDKLFHDQDMLTAAVNSLIIALTASVVSTILGTMAGVALYRHKQRLLQIL